MTKKNSLTVYKPIMGKAFTCGRTVAEEIETIERYGGHGVSKGLRSAVLAGYGISKPKDKAQNCIIFGCYRPFNTPFFVRDSIRLMDMLGIDYTYLDQEYCCGTPLFLSASDEQLEYVRDIGREYHLRNLNLARQKGAAKLAYCCYACVYAVRNTFREKPDEHVYVLDLILDGLKNHKIRIPPTVVGYFEGCHTFASSIYPAGSMDWSRYYQCLKNIEGLEVVDLPNNMCCKRSSDKIIETAEKMKLSKILVSCSGCRTSLSPAAKGRLQLISLPEFLFAKSGRR